VARNGGRARGAQSGQQAGIVGQAIEEQVGTWELLTRIHTWRMKTPNEELEKCIILFDDQYERMKYADARSLGWIIGSRNVEATCKTVVGPCGSRGGRMCWKERGAVPLLKVRR